MNGSYQSDCEWETAPSKTWPHDVCLLTIHMQWFVNQCEKRSLIRTRWRKKTVLTSRLSNWWFISTLLQRDGETWSSFCYIQWPFVTCYIQEHIMCIYDDDQSYITNQASSRHLKSLPRWYTDTEDITICLWTSPVWIMSHFSSISEEHFPHDAFGTGKCQTEIFLFWLKLRIWTLLLLSSSIRHQI